MGVQAFAGSEETVWTILAHEYEVYLECDGKGKIAVEKKELQNEFVFENNAFDLIRYWAAFCVMFFHYTGYALALSKNEGSTVMHVLRNIVSFFPGVVVLFALSGFLIAASYEHASGKKIFFLNVSFVCTQNYGYVRL